MLANGGRRLKMLHSRPFHLKQIDDAVKTNPLLQRRQQKVQGASSQSASNGDARIIAGGDGDIPFDPNQRCVRCDNPFDPEKPAISVNNALYHEHCHVDNLPCDRCGLPVDNEMVVSYGDRFWHRECFLCAQCFKPLANSLFYKYDLDGTESNFSTRYYCQHDFETLFAPVCGNCNRPIIDGEYIHLSPASFHTACFTCASCRAPITLRDGNTKCNGVFIARKLYCLACQEKLQAEQPACAKCGQPTPADQLILHKGIAYHAVHFRCTSCHVPLDRDARELRGELFCVPCYDKEVLVCGACRRALTDARRVFALKKYWHLEHFACAKCEQPFLGRPYFQYDNQAYCELDYHQLFGHICYQCGDVIKGSIFTAFGKSWCAEHFCCTSCSRRLTKKTKFYPLDQRPVCGPCFDRLPDDLQRLLMKYSAESYWPKDSVANGEKHTAT